MDRTTSGVSDVEWLNGLLKAGGYGSDDLKTHCLLQTHQRVSAFRIRLSGGSVNFDVVEQGIDGEWRTNRHRF